MQIVKCDRNSQLRKNEGTHLRKMNPQGSMARKLKNDKSHAPLRWGGVVGNTMAGGHQGCPSVVSCNTSQEETEEKGEVKDQMPMTCPRADHYDDDDDDVVSVA